MKLSRLLSLALLLSLFLPPLSFRASAAGGKTEHYLTVGIDDAASNTDVLAVISYDPRSSRVSVLQIPRDTYYCFGGVQNKLNQLYPYLLGGRDTRAARELAMKGLASAVSDLLGVRMTAYVAVSLSDFSESIDRLGGVPMRLPIDICYIDKNGSTVTLHAGVQTLSGEAAAAFVRHRASYPEGDLGRIDAQKLFLSALFARLGSRLSLRTMTSVFGGIKGSLVTDLTLSEAISCGMRFVRRYPSSSICYLTLPGAPAVHHGISYYSVSRTSAAIAVKEQLLFGRGDARIDRAGAALLADSPALSAIYHGESIYHVYTDAELKG